MTEQTQKQGDIDKCHVKFEHQTLVKSAHVLVLNNVAANLVQLRMQG